MKKNIYLLATRNNSTDYGMFTLGIKQAIDEQETVYAVPVKHEHWIEMERGHYFKCSNCQNPIPYKFGWKLYNAIIPNKRYFNFQACNHILYFLYSMRYIYCPHCGARMDIDEVSE